LGNGEVFGEESNVVAKEFAAVESGGDDEAIVNV